jgi:hypothetical protein
LINFGIDNIYKCLNNIDKNDINNNLMKNELYIEFIKNNTKYNTIGNMINDNKQIILSLIIPVIFMIKKIILSQVLFFFIDILHKIFKYYNEPIEEN